MKNRIENIKNKLKKDKIDAIFITNPYNISYLTNQFPSNYQEREYYLLITQNRTYLLAPKMFMLAIEDKINYISYVEITYEKGLYENVLEICKRENIKHLGFEEKNLLYKEFEHLDKIAKTKLIPLTDFIEKERLIKDSDEIEKIKKACKLTDETYSNVLKNIRMNVTEKELVWEIESYINKHGGEPSFSTIVAFGKNSAIPHHIPTNHKLKANSFVLLDFGAKVDGYTSDMSRTVYFGIPSDEEIKLYNTTLEAQTMAIEKLKEWKNNDFKVSNLHTISESHIEKNDFPLMPHSLGHGLGMEVHEKPVISKYSEGNDLQENMVITIEPGIYLPKLGGARIEDDILLTENGHEILTNSTRELTILK